MDWEGVMDWEGPEMAPQTPQALMRPAGDRGAVLGSTDDRRER